ncbi:amidohydrolase [Desulfoplanes formicivorans]|uniref:Amidohydrolase n=1 Tax=Desulfoplanes formicivorans TaxID=1592317 RepID=A0A194AKR4_9BACT|nr:amidohydrolase [Desulfoplanes formicivorans]GAU09299.1 amidohydrolase [Desulfoplanes formicivorans]
MKRTLYENGTVVTMDQRLWQADALVTEGSRILGVGGHEAMTALAGPDCNRVDMQGGALFPGFNETHNHLSMYAVCRKNAYLGACETIAQVVDTLRKHAASSEDPIIVGYCYDDTLLQDGRQISRHDLDEVSRDRPVVIIHISVHLAFLNTRALEHMGIGPDTPDPEGGIIHKDADGKPTGRLDETAWFAISDRLGSPDPETYVDLLDGAVREFNAQGITGVHDGGLGLEGMPDVVLSAYRRLEAEGRLGMRVFLSALPEIFDRMQPEPYTEMGDTRVLLGGVKLFVDGAIQTETAALLAPYADRQDWKGKLIVDPEEFEEQVARYHRAGHHMSIHGNGDAAIEAIITAMEKAGVVGSDASPRHMLIHCQMAHRDQLLRIRKAGLIPSFFCKHIHNWGDRHQKIFLGPERSARIDPAGEAEAMGLPFTLHVDTPVLPAQVIDSIHTAVNRVTRDGKVLGPDLGVTPYGAVAAYTSMAALCSRSENHRGTLTPGKLADMVLLDRDMTTVSPETISATRVLQTIVGGETVYSA